MQGDASLEAILDQYQIGQPEGLNCKNSNKIERMCINPKCDHQSLICNDLACSKCKGEGGEDHMFCYYIEFNGITSRLKKKSSIQKEFMMNCCEI